MEFSSKSITPTEQTAVTSGARAIQVIDDWKIGWRERVCRVARLSLNFSPWLTAT
jgi:hypothetical protein